jgi:hypothetical protein
VPNYGGAFIGGLAGMGVGAGLGAWRAGKGHRGAGAAVGALPGFYAGEMLGGLIPRSGTSAPPPPWAPPIRDDLSKAAPWLRDATSQAEAKAMFRQRARAMHPDVGGSTAAMQRLNEEWEQAQVHPSFSRLKKAYELGRAHAHSTLRLYE